MVMKFTNTSNISRNGYKFCIYGECGEGKTTLARTCPKPFILAGENGLISLADFNIDATEPIKTFKEFEEVVNWMLNSKEANKYETFYIDALTTISNILRLEIINSYSTKKEAKTNTFSTYADIHDTIYPLIFDLITKTNKNVVVTCSMADLSKDGIIPSPRYTLLLEGQKLISSLKRMFDFIFVSRKFISEPDENGHTTDEYYLQTQSCDEYYAKSRQGTKVKLDLLEPHNLGRIIRKLEYFRTKQ